MLAWQCHLEALRTVVEEFKHVSDVLRVLALYQFHHNDQNLDVDDDNGNVEDKNDACLYDKIELHVKLSANEEVKHRVHHLLVLNLLCIHLFIHIHH